MIKFDKSFMKFNNFQSSFKEIFIKFEKFKTQKIILKPQKKSL